MVASKEMWVRETLTPKVPIFGFPTRGVLMFVGLVLWVKINII